MLNRLHRFGHVHRMEENRIPKKVLYTNLETRLRGRPRYRWQDEVREDGRLVGGKGWKERIYNRQEWKKLLRMARNHHILHMPMEWHCTLFSCWTTTRKMDIKLLHPDDRPNTIHFLLFQNLRCWVTKKKCEYSVNTTNFKLTSSITFRECRRCPEN